MITDILLYVIISICIVIMVHSILLFFIKTTTTYKQINNIDEIKEVYNKLNEKLENNVIPIEYKYKEEKEQKIDEDNKTDLLNWLDNNMETDELFKNIHNQTI